MNDFPSPLSRRQTASTRLKHALRSTLLVGLGALGLGSAGLSAQFGDLIRDRAADISTTDRRAEVDPKIADQVRKGSEAFFDRRFGDARLHLANARQADDALAHFYLGLMHFHALGGPKHVEAARQHLERSAAKGCVLAMRAMAELHSGGGDHEQEQRWLRTAAVHGDAFSQWMLATRLIETDEALDAAAFATIAVRSGFDADAATLASLIDHGGAKARDGLDARITALEAEIKKEMDGGLIFLEAPIGDTIRRGELRAADPGVEAYFRKAYDESRRLLAPLAASGDTNACFYMGRMLESGLGDTRDVPPAIVCYAAASLRDDAWSMNNLGLILQHGDGVPAMKAEAFQLFRRGALLGNPGAMLNLGFCYGTGQGTTEDLVRACCWYQLAADRGDETAKNNLSSVLPHLQDGERREFETMTADLNRLLASAYAAVALPELPIAEVDGNTVRLKDGTELGRAPGGE